jgi:hypothetical protein
MAERLIVTNGDVAAARLKEAGIAGDILPWRDALHDGPAPIGLVLEALSLVRAQFLAGAFGHRLGEVIGQFVARDAALRNHGQHQRVELWFEHDLYDQLQLIQVLDFLAADGRREGLLLVQTRDYIGTLPRSALRVLGEHPAPVGAAQSALAQRAWTAFTAPTPERLARLATAPTSALPHLGPALARFVQEFPAVSSGLGLTEEHALDVLADGPKTVADLFAATQAKEKARFLGDASFFKLLDGLAFAAKPLIAGLEYPSIRCAGGPDSADYRRYAAMRVEITDAGRAALAGDFDHAVENGIDRWFGGTHITAKALWRRDAQGLAQPA